MNSCPDTDSDETSTLITIGALAYALTLEGIILTNDARSLSTYNAVSFFK